MSNQFVNTNPKIEPALKPSFTGLVDPNPGGKNAGQSIGYGALVVAKLLLYKLENLFSKLQQLESEIAGEMYKLTATESQSLGESTLKSMNSEAEQMMTDSIGQFISGGVQIGMAGAQGVLNVRADRKMAGLTEENQTLEKYQTTFSEDAPRVSPATNRGEEQTSRLSTPQADKEANERLAELKKGNFDREFENKETRDRLDSNAAKIANNEEREAVREQAQKRVKANDAKKHEITTDKNTYNTYAQMGAGVTQSLKDGITGTIKSDQKRQQATFEADKNVTQSTLSMVNASDAFKAMDGFQQDALSILKIVEAVEQANRYQPA